MNVDYSLKFFAVVLAVLATVVSCNEPETDPAGTGGSGGSSGGVTSTSSSCVDTTGSSTQSSSASASSSSSGSGIPPVSCLPCNAKLDDRATPTTDLCPDSLKLWELVQACACPYSVDSNGDMNENDYCLYGLSMCLFDAVPSYSVCDHQVRWYCEDVVKNCAHDWANFIKL